MVAEKQKILVPQLRFKEFQGDWKREKIGSCIKLLTDYHANGSYDRLKENVELLSDKNFAVIIRTTNLEKNDFQNNLLYISEHAYHYLKKSKVFEDDIIINKIANAGATYIMPKVDFPVSLAMNLFLIRTKENYSAKFVFLSIKNKEQELRNLASGTSTKTITKDDVRGFRINFPNLTEQQKIASFLTAVDKKLQQLITKKEQLEYYKKGVMQKLFSQQLRFKDENGNDFPDWEEKKLGELANRKSKKNKDGKVTFVLTNSATQGIVSQQDYFDRDIANQNNLEGYYVVSKDDFVYNPRISVHAPVGPIKRNKLQKGVMSPLYSVFRFSSDNLEYFEYFFETVVWHKYLNSVANFGARHDRMNISNEDFFKMPIPMPSNEESKKIATYLSTLNAKMETVTGQIEKTKEFKKGLLQQLFV